MNRYHTMPPDGLSQRARSFVAIHSIRLDPRRLEDHRAFWRGREIPDEQIDRMIAFEERWGGFALAPAPAYEGGPRILGADSPDGGAEDGWWFEAGVQRCSVPYSFMIGPNGEFGIHGPKWVPLHSRLETRASKDGLNLLPWPNMPRSGRGSSRRCVVLRWIP